MLTPVLQAAGYQRHSGRLGAASGWHFSEMGVVSTSLSLTSRCRTWTDFEFAEAVRSDMHLAELPIIALSSVVSAEAIERGRRVGFHDYVAKFDRQGLIAALKEQTAWDRRRDDMNETPDHSVCEYVTAVIGGQLFGLPISACAGCFCT